MYYYFVDIIKNINQKKIKIQGLKIQGFQICMITLRYSNYRVSNILNIMRNIVLILKIVFSLFE